MTAPTDLSSDAPLVAPLIAPLIAPLVAPFAIVDCETTGLDPENDRIVELAILLSDGRQILARKVFLLDPQQRIPSRITELTGIAPRDVLGCPRFEQVAREIIELTEGKTLVAHNLRFDYGFLCAEFRRLGYAFRRNQLCTLRMAREHFPGQASYSLGRLCAALEVPHRQSHRAEGDAEAAAEIFHRVYHAQAADDAASFARRERRPAALPSQLRVGELDALPNDAGVYYFYDAHRTLLYVGKSRRIRERVVSHFMADTRSLRERKMKEAVARIDYVQTGSELVALLLESAEIKLRKPLYNRAQRKEKYSVAVHVESGGAQNYLRLALRPVRAPSQLDQLDQPDQPAPVDPRSTAVRFFASATKAHAFLDQLVQREALCSHLVSTGKSHRVPRGPCFPFQLERCRGACVGRESADDYNARLRAALGLAAVSATSATSELPVPVRESASYLLVEPGRARGEHAVVLVRQGIYQGYGFTRSFRPTQLARAVACVEPRTDYPDIRRILARYRASAPRGLRCIELPPQFFHPHLLSQGPTEKMQNAI